jgi:hypothetical protein
MPGSIHTSLASLGIYADSSFILDDEQHAKFLACNYENNAPDRRVGANMNMHEG